ncbi:MAG: cation transporter [Kiritimatiellae bacterium]|nr:cation transporter [Kiritimatiellia bacterium]MDD4736079.1 cation transporter [Kiritimatiellia bacterium]
MNNQTSFNHVDAHRFVIWAFSFSCIQFPASVYTVLATHAQIALVPLVLSLSGILAEGGWLFVYRQMKEGNIYKFPYGTKKMENALAFLDAGFIFLGVVYGLFEMGRSIRADHVAPNLRAAIVLLFFGFCSGCVVLYQVIKARKRYESPGIEVFYSVYRFAVLRDLTVLFLIAAAALIGHQTKSYVYWSDVIISLGLLLLLGVRSVKLLRSNFSALIEWPLPEKDQLLVLQALAPHLERMEKVGNIRTSKRGGTRVIDVEARFPATTTNAELLHLQQDIQKRLSRHFADFDFHILIF